MRIEILMSFKSIMSRIRSCLIVVVILLPSQVAAEMQFLSIAENAVVMYDAPSLKAEKLYVASLHLPVEAVVAVEGWIKVRDSSGSLAWVENKFLSQQQYVIVIVPLADIYQAPDDRSELVFQAQEGVVIEWLNTDGDTPGWMKVRHRDGQVGYVKVGQVWGS